jgi:MYXO-CTERM domain-containing protein
MRSRFGRSIRGPSAALAVAAAALGLASGAHATALLSDGFDNENAPTNGSILNYGTVTGSFANFTVDDGTVDLIRSGTFGISCLASLMCVDLDGTTFDPGVMTTRQAYSFAAGDTVTLSFQASGNQRGGNQDTLAAGFALLAPTDLTQFWGGGFGMGGAGSLSGVTEFSRSDLLASADPFQLYTVGFTAQQAGAFRVFFSASSTDLLGPILDAVNIDGPTQMSSPGIPEPASWALAILGFGGVGAMARRRRTALA